MIFMRSILTGIALLGLLGFAATARAAETPTYVIPANINDAGIDPARGKNHVWSPERPVGKLLVVMGGGGALNLPEDWSELGTEGARLGYHTIVLAYSNAVPIAAPAGCGPNVDPPASPENCAFDARMEIFDGREESSVVAVSRANSIENRLTKVLQHLQAIDADGGWSQFLDTSGVETGPRWSEIVVSGQSLGAGQAVLIGMLHLVHRVVAFAGFTDAKHGWVTSEGVTPTNRYFALIHQRDDFFERACFAYLPLGLAASCPLADFTLAENQEPPFGTPLLVFNLDPDSTPPSSVGDPEHTGTTRDGWIPKELDGTTPSQKLVNAWRSVLGDSDADTWLDQVDNCPQVPNPALDEQLDTDRDGLGDVCDPTPQGTTPPVIAPDPVTVDATGPAGAIANYAVTAEDDIDGAVAVLCTPSTGSAFAIGQTTVECAATDAAGNAGHASFVVIVLGAKEQIVNLIREVIDSTRLPAGVKAQLIASLQALVAGFDPSEPAQRKVACVKLKVFASLVRYLAPPAQAAAWAADANRIRAVLVC